MTPSAFATIAARRTTVDAGRVATSSTIKRVTHMASNASLRNSHPNARTLRHPRSWKGFHELSFRILLLRSSASCRVLLLRSSALNMASCVHSSAGTAATVRQRGSTLIRMQTEITQRCVLRRMARASSNRTVMGLSRGETKPLNGGKACHCFLFHGRIYSRVRRMGLQSKIATVQGVIPLMPMRMMLLFG